MANLDQEIVVAQAKVDQEVEQSAPEQSLTNRYSPELLARLGSLSADVATVEWHHPSLKEEVDAWNQQNPDKLISLVRVTPAATRIETELRVGGKTHCE